jgi:hypothetical protein
MAQVDLIPEPEGGQELIPNNSMDGTRVKLMGEADGLSSDDGTVYKFWMQTIAQGELIKKFKIDILKESKKKVRAHFVGKEMDLLIKTPLSPKLTAMDIFLLPPSVKGQFSRLSQRSGTTLCHATNPGICHPGRNH